MKLGESATEMNAKLQKDFGDECMTRWYKMYTEGRIDVEGEGRNGRPTTSRTDENGDRVREIKSKRSSWDATSNGISAGRSVCNPKEPALKA